MHVARAEMFVAMNARARPPPEPPARSRRARGADHRARAPGPQRRPRRVRLTQEEHVTAKIADIRRSYVDGAFVTGEGAPLAVENPATEETVAEVETLSLAQMEAAVLAARRAFDGGGWSGLPPRAADRRGARARRVPGGALGGARRHPHRGGRRHRDDDGRAGGDAPRAPPSGVRAVPHHARRRAHARARSTRSPSATACRRA